MCIQSPLVACIDDEESIREALSGLLSSLGFDVEVFDSAESFLERGDFGEIACLVTDIRLRGKSGLDLQQQLLNDGYRIPTIVITAFDDPRFRAQAEKAGAVCFLRKPIHREDLVACIEAALRSGAK